MEISVNNSYDFKSVMAPKSQEGRAGERREGMNEVGRREGGREDKGDATKTLRRREEQEEAMRMSGERKKTQQS